LMLVFLSTGVKSRFGQPVELVVTTRKEFLGIEASEVQIQ